MFDLLKLWLITTEISNNMKKCIYMNIIALRP